MTSLITTAGGALVFDGVTWPAALKWLKETGWHAQTVDTAAGQCPRIDVTLSVEGAALPVRELQVLVGMSEGKSNAEIGEGMHLGEQTVKTYARRLFVRLGARDRAHAVAIAYQRQILSGPQ
jgi:DNA-binding NarL/FixJ family response regulator